MKTHSDANLFRSMINRVFAKNDTDAAQRNSNIKAVLKTYDGHIDEAEKDDIASFIIFGLKGIGIARKYEVQKEARSWEQ